MNTNTQNQTEHQAVPAISMEAVLDQLAAITKRLEAVASDLAANAKRRHTFTTQTYLEMRVEAELLAQFCRGDGCAEASGLAEGVRAVLSEGLHLPAKQVERLVGRAMLRLFDSKFECSVEVAPGRVIDAYVGVALRDGPSEPQVQG